VGATARGGLGAGSAVARPALAVPPALAARPLPLPTTPHPTTPHPTPPPPAAAAYRLLPMGSHPRVADRRGAYDLFGPVSKLWAQSYDRAMAIYLACLREFGDFARAR
jgi:hypothetical protein